MARDAAVTSMAAECPVGEGKPVNNLIPNTRQQEVFRGITAKAVNNRRTIFSRIPGTNRVPVRATDEAPASPKTCIHLLTGGFLVRIQAEEPRP